MIKNHIYKKRRKNMKNYLKTKEMINGKEILEKVTDKVIERIFEKKIENFTESELFGLRLAISSHIVFNGYSLDCHQMILIVKMSQW